VRKVERALQDECGLQTIRDSESTVRRSKIENLTVGSPIDAIITSPPYMNALDYRRDNRLRLWFLDRRIQNYSPEPTDRFEAFQQMISALCTRAIAKLRVGGRCVLVVGETVNRNKITSHPAETIITLLAQLAPELQLESVVEDAIPDVRRARRKHYGTKKELVLVFEKRKRRTVL